MTSMVSIKWFLKLVRRSSRRRESERDRERKRDPGEARAQWGGMGVGAGAQTSVRREEAALTSLNRRSVSRRRFRAPAPFPSLFLSLMHEPEAGAQHASALFVEGGRGGDITRLRGATAAGRLKRIVPDCKYETFHRRE